MNRNHKLLIGTIGLVVIGVVVLIFVGPSLQRSFFYPKPQGLPPVVADTTENLLARLQVVLETNAPIVAQALQPGLSEERIAAMEKEGGFRLSDDLRALYRWHNGVSTKGVVGLLPGHRFTPLDELVAERVLVRQHVLPGSAIQSAASWAFAGHRDNWVHVFNDGAGDGYFFDPERSDADGAFFYHFTEAGYYVWFPSFRNFLAGVIECHETGTFKLSADGESLDEDFDRADQIWERLAKKNVE